MRTIASKSIRRYDRLLRSSTNWPMNSRIDDFFILCIKIDMVATTTANRVIREKDIRLIQEWTRKEASCSTEGSRQHINWTMDEFKFRYNIKAA
jgi:hypothetical protein